MSILEYSDLSFDEFGRMRMDRKSLKEWASVISSKKIEEHFVKEWNQELFMA